jgi:CheY-like chemotaxis protein
MSGLSYRDLTTKTFCDDAIRSVMMIDDDFLPYDRLAREYAAPTPLAGKYAAGSLKAANIHEFFQRRKIACDVDSGTEHLDPDRIRKCDLIILDYHLEHQNPSRSIELIRALRKNAHMNLVVVYTSENLETTWLEICASLRGGGSYDHLFDNDPVALEKWEHVTEGRAKIPREWVETVTLTDINDFLIQGRPGTDLKRRLRAIPEIGGDAALFAAAVCEKRIDELNLVRSDRDTQAIVGHNGAVRWIQSGNVFIALHSKSPEDNDATGIWETLTTAVAEWSPTYYQLIVSEVQNWLENEPLPFDAEGLSDPEGQSAWLSSILQESCVIKRQIMVEQLLERLTEEFKDKLISNVNVKEFTTNALDCLSSGAGEAKSANDFDSYCATHMKMENPNNQPAVQLDMFHSLNADLCSRKFTGDHITNGSVLHNARNGKYYLCVSPACDAVPEQETSPLAQRMSPHRFMKVLELISIRLGTALKEAVYGRHIFIKVGRERLALAVQDSNSHNPIIDYALVHNHLERNRNIVKDGITVSFLSVGEDGGFAPDRATLIPIAQLREGYTARFQTVASHHSGRVGVDYVSFPTKVATPRLAATGAGTPAGETARAEGRAPVATAASASPNQADAPAPPIEAGAPARSVEAAASAPSVEAAAPGSTVTHVDATSSTSAALNRAGEPSEIEMTLTAAAPEKPAVQKTA